jgi:hypothetical protein
MSNVKREVFNRLGKSVSTIIVKDMSLMRIAKNNGCKIVDGSVKIEGDMGVYTIYTKSTKTDKN